MTESPPAMSSASSSSLLPPAAPPSMLSLPPLLRATSTPIRFFNDKDWAALIEDSKRDALIENAADAGVSLVRQTRRRESSISADLPFLTRSSSSGSLQSPILSQSENDSGHDSLGDTARSDNELSSTADVSTSPPSLSSQSSSASSSGHDNLGARPKTWTRSKTIYKR